MAVFRPTGGRIAGQSAKEFHLALLNETATFKAMETEEIKLLANQGIEFLHSAFNQCQSRLDLKKEESLSEHILPEIHESKNYLASKAIELMESLAEKLDVQSLDFSVDFMQALDGRLEEMSQLSEDIFEKNVSMQRESKEVTEALLSKLDEQLAERARITHKLLSSKAKDSAMEEVSQQKINERLDSLKSTYLSKVSTKISVRKIVDEKDADIAFQRFEFEAEKAFESLVDQLQARSRDISQRRIRSIKELERKLQIVKDKSELLTDALTKNFDLE